MIVLTLVVMLLAAGGAFGVTEIILCDYLGFDSLATCG